MNARALKISKSFNASFELDGNEYDFYDALTRYVEDQSIKASEDDSARGRALSFTMAMLQRRFASSVYAVRRSLERMRDKRQKILRRPGEIPAIGARSLAELFAYATRRESRNRLSH